MVTHKVRYLVFDHQFYLRQQVDWDHVQRLADAIEIGAALPPIIVCKATRRIVDGCHRAKAMQRLKGDRAEIACIEKSYATQEAYFIDAIKYNSEHGLALTAKDRFRILELGEELKIDPAITAAAMSMSTTAIGKLSVAPIDASVRVHRPAASVSPRFGPPRIPAPEPRREPFHRASEYIPHRPALPQVIEQKPEPVSHQNDIELVKRLIHRLEEDKINFDAGEMADLLVRLTEILVAMDLANC